MQRSERRAGFAMRGRTALRRRGHETHCILPSIRQHIFFRAVGGLPVSAEYAVIAENEQLSVHRFRAADKIDGLAVTNLKALRRGGLARADECCAGIFVG